MTLPRRSRRPLSYRAVVVALYVNATILAAVLVALIARDGHGSISLLTAARAADGPAMGGGGNLYVIPGQFSQGRYGCYLMDTDAQTLCVYQFDGASTKLRLVAARNFRHDRRLGQLNTEPDPKEVEMMVETERSGRRGQAQPGDAGDGTEGRIEVPPATGRSKSRGNPD